ncbi:hypothetical protein N7504_008043 [Penicillium tannophilum]|nr:hypothetical protein N7504_008043 [Penicillium tannophilum]
MTSLWDVPRGRINRTWESHGASNSVRPSESSHQASRDSQADTNEEDMIEDIYYINSLNQTVAAAWDLHRPETNDQRKSVRPRRTETLAFGADRRSKVSSVHIQPGGKFRAICKLFMRFSRNQKYDYMGTGWLIANDIVVTAGHCLYDANGGYLESIRAYIGYQGPEDTALQRNQCQMRLGRTAVLPVEYIKTSHTVHDVGFIKLDQPFDNVTPFEPLDTPRAVSGIRLGVVGYPGDINSGNDMFEHWDLTEINISKNRYLTYSIDIEAGESGSPVLRQLEGTSKAAPNAEAVSWAKKVAATGVRGTRSLEYIGLPARPEAAGDSGKDAGVDERVIEAARAVRDLESGYNNPGNDEDKTPKYHREAARKSLELIRGHLQKDGRGGRSFILPQANRNYPQIIRNRKESGDHKEMCTKSPRSLGRDEYKESGGSSGANHDDLLQQAMDKLNTNQDIKTMFFVDFPLTLTGEAREKMNAVVDNVRDWQSWVYGLSMSKVQEQINAGKLSAAPTAVDEAKRATYKNMVFDHVMRSCNWLAQTYDEVQTKNIECSKLDLRTTLLKNVLEGFSVPGNIMGKLHAALNSISQGIISFAKENKAQSMQYFIMLTRYEYEQALERISAVIRVISFRTDATLNTYNLNKSSYQSATFQFVFHHYQCDFNDILYNQIKSQIDPLVQEQGHKLKQMTASEIKIEVDTV